MPPRLSRTRWRTVWFHSVGGASTGSGKSPSQRGCGLAAHEAIQLGSADLFGLCRGSGEEGEHEAQKQSSNHHAVSRSHAVEPRRAVMGGEAAIDRQIDAGDERGVVARRGLRG